MRFVNYNIHRYIERKLNAFIVLLPDMIQVYTVWRRYMLTITNIKPSFKSTFRLKKRKKLDMCPKDTDAPPTALSKMAPWLCQITISP